MKKALSVLLVLALFLSIAPMQIFAAAPDVRPDLPAMTYGASQQIGPGPIGPQGYVPMRTSQAMLDIIKVMEGYSQRAYYDYSQSTIGYGTKANSPNEVLPDGRAGYEEAERRLIADVKTREDYLNWYFRNDVEKQPTQNQFDALLSFTYNNGTAWTNGSMLDTWLHYPTTELDFMNALGQWCHVGTTPWYSLAQRRIREALIFLKGQYYLPFMPQPEHLIKTTAFRSDPSRFVRYNGNLPYFASVIRIFDTPSSSVSGDRIEYKYYGDVVGPLPIPEAEGYTFDGWAVVAVNDSRISPARITEEAVVNKNLELHARWIKKDAEPDPDKPVLPDFDNPDAPYPEADPDFPDVTESTGLPFLDVYPHSWFLEDVRYVYENGYMKGTNAELFSPKMEMTRGMLVTVLYRIDGAPAVSEEYRHPFEDVGEDYYTDAVAWARYNNIVLGISDTEFAPDVPVTREDAMVIFHRYCVEYLGASRSQEADLSQFVDAGEIFDYAVEAIQWATAVDLFRGTPVGDGVAANPKGLLNRAECSALLTRCMKEIVN